MPENKTYPKCWLFDINRRIYKKDESGHSMGGPIWREHWVKVEIVGETSRSWITSWGNKIPKKGGSGIAFSEEDIDREEFLQKRWKIADRVSSCRDYETLRKVADILGFE